MRTDSFLAISKRRGVGALAWTLKTWREKGRAEPEPQCFRRKEGGVGNPSYTCTKQERTTPERQASQGGGTKGPDSISDGRVFCLSSGAIKPLSR